MSNGIFLTIALSYLLGSVSFGILVSKLAYKDDVRRHGSGNAGTTNALRVYGGKAAAWVFAGDFLKGALAVWLGGLIALEPRMGRLMAALFVVLGHLYPVYFGFRGGKGVATAAGAVLVLYPPVLLILAVPFALTAVLTRYMSLASIIAAGLLPVVAIGYQFWGGKPITSDIVVEIPVALLIGSFVIWMHRANIGRLLKGTESKLGQKAQK